MASRFMSTSPIGSTLANNFFFEIWYRSIMILALSFQVKGNNVGDVHVVLKRKYRQYMNRKGGFNRPLDYVH